MVRVSKANLKNIFVLSTAFLLVECANQLPPGGGDIDRTPPVIVEVYPEDGTINFSDEYFEIGFSEYVERRSVKEAIFISPAIDGDLELDWSGKYVRVFFPNQLRVNTTYVITIGTDVVDYNNRNNMAEAFTFAFSTGNEIDKRVITGKVYDKNPQGIMLFAYLVKNENLNPLEVKPDYISQSNSDGSYKLAGLSAGLYRIFAVRDEFRDLIYQPEQDEIGIPFREVYLAYDDTIFTGVDFMLTKIDTIKPRIITANMTDRNHILVNSTEELEKSSINAFNFYLFDSTASKRVQIRYAFKGNTKPSEFVLVPNEILPINNLVYLFADTVRDLSGNIFLNDFTLVTISEKVDTSKVELHKSIPTNGSIDVDFSQPSFTFMFNDAFSKEAVRSGITFADTLKKNIPFEINFIDDASFIVFPLGKLEVSKNYIINIDMSKLIDFAGNYQDTVIQYKFKTISGLEFTGTIGRVINFDANKNLIIELNNLENADLKYLLKPQMNGTFNFNRVVAGKYQLFAYYDIDSSNTYSFGYPFPFNFSEEFFFYPDTLNLRARWTETDLKFELNRR